MKEFDFYFAVALSELLLRHSDNLSAGMQKETISAAQAQDIARLTIKTLSALRKDETSS